MRNFRCVRRKHRVSDKIKNSLEQDYPEGKLKFLFVTDGSDDGTPDDTANNDDTADTNGGDDQDPAEVPVVQPEPVRLSADSCRPPPERTFAANRA